MNMTTLRHEAWTDESWRVWRDKLETCPLAVLQRIATRVGVNFAGGNETVADADTIILALDEVSPDALAKAYEAEVKPPFFRRLISRLRRS